MGTSEGGKNQRKELEESVGGGVRKGTGVMANGFPEEWQREVWTLILTLSLTLNPTLSLLLVLTCGVVGYSGLANHASVLTSGWRRNSNLRVDPRLRRRTRICSQTLSAQAWVDLFHLSSDLRRLL